MEATDKTDKNGNVVKVTKWNLRYPETIVPPTENTEVVQMEAEAPQNEDEHFAGSMMPEPRIK